MKELVLSLPDDLMRDIERAAASDRRAPSDFVALQLQYVLYGRVGDLPPLTEQELTTFRSRTTPRINFKARDRNYIFERDGGKCRHCAGQLLYDEPWHIDHLTPLSKGGSNDIANLALSCVRCNLEKSAKVAA